MLAFSVQDLKFWEHLDATWSFVSSTGKIGLVKKIPQGRPKFLGVHKITIWLTNLQLTAASNAFEKMGVVEQNQTTYQD